MSLVVAVERVVAEGGVGEAEWIRGMKVLTMRTESMR